MTTNHEARARELLDRFTTTFTLPDAEVAGAASVVYAKGALAAVAAALTARDAELRALAEKWRTTGDGYKPSGTWSGNDMCDRYHWCADELLALIGKGEV